MNRATIKSYAASLRAASMNRRAAVQIEIAVGFAVCLDTLPQRRLAKETLVSIYADAGVPCREPGDVEWKSVQRRISATLDLFDHIGENEVKKWAGDAQRTVLINQLVAKIEPLKLASTNEIISVCKKEPKPGEKRRGPRPGTHIDTDNVHLVIPPDTSPDELMQLAQQILQLASKRRNEMQDEADKLMLEHASHETTV
jgi:hypothetical protein